MPITPTYPGLYIEELPSNAKTITAAPTSVTVFVGYTHPYKTKETNFGKAVQIFSMTEYEREFGGLYASGEVHSEVAYAVNQFFLNGGSSAYVVGLRLATGLPKATATVGPIRFEALEPADLVTMAVTVDNLASSGTQADITLAYGNHAETYRKVALTPKIGAADNPDYVVTRLKNSALANVFIVDANLTAFTAKTLEPFIHRKPTNFTGSVVEDFLSVFDSDGSLDKVPIFNLLCIPGVADIAVWSAALSFCERKHAFVILDPPVNAAADNSDDKLRKVSTAIEILPKSANGGLYFPYLKVPDPILNKTRELPPSGTVAGLFSRIDQNRGVWKSPAGLEALLNNVGGVVESGVMTDQTQGTLNPKGVNCIRTFPGVGTVVFGARTQVTENPAFQQWRYVAVRRTALFIEQTLLNNLGWVVFEPNDQPLWVAIRTSIESFMLTLFNQGAFQGSKPSQAFQVICDSTTTTQQDINNGVVNIVVAFAPLKPAEFVIIKISQIAGQGQ